MDWSAARAFIARCADSTSALAIRTDRAFLVAVLSPVYFWSRIAAQNMILVAEPGAIWDAVRLARRARDWAAERGAVKYCLAAETGIDLGPIARRIGAIPDPACYKVVLQPERP